MRKNIILFYIFFFISILTFSCSKTSPLVYNDDKLVISGLIPNSFYIGSFVEIDGKLFGDGLGSSFVSFNGSKPQTADYTLWSDSKIIVRVPAGATSGNLYVQAYDKKSNEVKFVILQSDSNGPVITGLSQSIAQTGQSIKILGKNFGATRGTSFVQFNGAPATVYTSWDNNNIIVTVPDAALTGDIAVYVNNRPSNTKKFTVQESSQLLKLVVIPSGKFIMGNNKSDDFDDKPEHEVTFTKSIWMSKYEVTQKQWGVVMDNSNPSHPNDLGPDKPVQQVTFVRACDFCNRLSKIEGFKQCYTINGEDITCDFTANGYRLPTEAEWEYAAKAGGGDFTEAQIQAFGWVSENAEKKIHDVGLKPANAFGLFDMIGNVSEWCWDIYADDMYSNSPKNDPIGPASSDIDLRIRRGGSFINGAAACRVSKRESLPGKNGNFNFDLGFRVVRAKN